jgi:ribose transport system ATP-binding protein
VEANEPMLTIENLSKTFGGNKVLRDVAMSLVPGEVHALLGQNGSGKSTIIKILSAFHEPDPGGSMTMRGEPVKLPLSTTDPKQLGLEFVHQNLGLVETMTVADNYLLGRYPTGFAGKINWSKAREECMASLKDLGATIEDCRVPLAEVHHQADRALLAIARATTALRQFHGTGVLVLDEPTVYLPKEEVDLLKQTVRSLAARGNCILYVTHRLDELPGFADKVTVIRDGAVVDTKRAAEVSVQQIVGMILGRELGALYPHVERAHQKEVLTVKNLKGRRINGLDLSLHEGEVLGVTGLVGMGYEDLPYLLWGSTRAKAGEFHYGGWEIGTPTPAKCLKLGMALLPSDRARQGAVMTASLCENLSLPVLTSRHFRGGWLRKSSELREARRLIDEFSVTPANPAQALGRFSGGNQQKALLAKWLQTDPKVVLLDEPTQGIDIGSKRDIFARIARIASQGSAVLVASAEYEDLANICHRVLVLRQGRIVAELTGAALTKENIIQHCYLA